MGGPLLSFFLSRERVLVPGRDSFLFLHFFSFGLSPTRARTRPQQANVVDEEEGYGEEEEEVREPRFFKILARVESLWGI